VPRMTTRQAECGSACGRTPSVSGTVLLSDGAVVVIPTRMREWGGSLIVTRVPSRAALRTSIRATEQHRGEDEISERGDHGRGDRPRVTVAAAMPEELTVATELAGDRLELASTGASGPNAKSDGLDEDAPASTASETPERIGRYLVL